MDMFVKLHPYSNSKRGKGRREEREEKKKKAAAEKKKEFASLTALGIAVRLNQFLFRHQRLPISIWQDFKMLKCCSAMVLFPLWLWRLVLSGASCSTFPLQGPEKQQYVATSEGCHTKAWPNMFMNETVILALVGWSLTECCLRRLWCSNSRRRLLSFECATEVWKQQHFRHTLTHKFEVRLQLRM